MDDNLRPPAPMPAGIGSAAFDYSPAEKARMGLPVMAPTAAPSATPWVPASEVERLRALLRETHSALVATPIYPAPGTALHVIAKRIAAEFKVDPAPLPYSVEGRTIVCARSLAIATVDGPEGEREATAEFIARACSSFPELVRVAREGLKNARYCDALMVYKSGQCSSPPAPIMSYDQARAAVVIEAATGERP